MINWKIFEAKYENREQWAFEQMSYFLFCIEMNNNTGAFRYKNQTGIETEPIEKEGVFYGFQSKYYTTSISQNKKEIIDSLKKAKTKNKKLNIVYFYISQEFSESSKKNKKKALYQVEIENEADKINITVEWRVKSHLEYQLSQSQNKWITNIFFDGTNSLSPDYFKNQTEKEIINLGPRFSEELNFELPIAQLFDAISHNEVFYQKLLSVIDKWLTEKGYRKQKENKYLSILEKELEALKNDLSSWFTHFDYSLDEQIQLTDFLYRLQQFNGKISDKTSELYDQKNQKTETNKFDNELGRLREIEDENHKFLKRIEELKISLANNPTLIIQGEAGCGKSHLLGDIATKRKNESLPTLLLLGTTFNSSNTIEQNILNRLDLSYSFKEFLADLNNIGLYVNSRVLILIDAINEGAGVDLWKNQIAGFISDIAKYPAIGLVLTIRSTYYDDIIPKDFKTNPKINMATHIGFKGNEYEALKLFSEFYGLTLPNFPILNPEFSNPLFLHLICEYCKNLPEKNFPKGFNGITKIYNSYKKILDIKFGDKRHEYKNREIVTKAINIFADAIFNTKYGHLGLEDVVNLFDERFPRFPHLLTDLIEESVFVKMRPEYEEPQKDFISFSYQKLGDFFMAEELLKGYTTKEKLIDAFKDDEKIQRIRNNYHWQYHGIVEILAVLLPEQYDVELFELIEFFYDKNDKRDKDWVKDDTYQSFTKLLLDSLKWRKLSSIKEKKITKWLVDNGKLDYDEWLYTLTELTATSKHPFNSDRLHKILLKQSMPNRDSFWQGYLKYYNGYDDNDIAFPLRRLIDWAWSPNISINTDTDTSRLVAQTLVWVLASTNIELRDQTTKALVNLLEQQPEVLITILKSFKEVDDLYILERLYAVAYGCILRTEEEKSIRIIAKYIYNTIFKDKIPPSHILLRDYARNAIEYAIFKKVELKVDEKLIRPPYNSEMPILPQNEDEVEKYKLDYESPGFKESYGFEHNAIYNSVISGIADFGHYIVESAVRKFASISFKEEEIYDHFIKTLDKEKKDFIDLFFKSKERKNNLLKRFDNIKKRGINLTSDQERYVKMFQGFESFFEKEFNNYFNSEEVKFFNDNILPIYEKKIKADKIAPWPIRYGIVKRVFELGYDRKLHGDYDNTVSNFYYSRHENKIERIGKKYQWIAFYEIMSSLTDNYKLNESWSSDDKYEFYKGAWQLNLRNVDPAYITKNSEESEDYTVKTVNAKEWWADKEYQEWNYPDSEWVKTINDLPNPKEVIEKKERNNTEWLYLEHFVKWNEPKKIGVDRYEGRRKEIWYLIQALLVKKSDKKKIISYLKQQNFWGRWLPENRDDYSSLMNREKFWSPAYMDTYNENIKIWDTVRETNHKVIISTESANGGIENDKSNANKKYNIPCKFIFEGMKLRYSPTDGNLENERGETIVTNSKPHSVLIRKRDLMEFLESKNLTIIWTLLGEKFSFDNHDREDSYFKVPCAVYYLENGKLEGEIKMYERD
mgnify:CR=1 FL=1|tara:strand:- start:16639 stop:21111 length:4473 start_codon:yes stop_codon:yes gene_type:complete